MTDYTSSLIPSATSVVFWVLRLLPVPIIYFTGLTYTGLALLVAWAIIFAGHRQLWPAEKLGRLVNAIDSTLQILKATKSDCTRVAMIALMALEPRFLQAQHRASEINQQLLTINEQETWMAWFRAGRDIGRCIDQCADDVRRIRTELLVIAEKDRQRKISEEIRETQEVLPTIDPSCVPQVPRTNRRRFGLQAISEVFQELYGQILESMWDSRVPVN
ncbi:hypothetical protein FB45DRAFT_907653, partial [Roridomyces roridus]